MAHVDSASVYFENGRAFVRMEIDELTYLSMLGALSLAEASSLEPLIDLLVASTREKSHELDWSRYDDAPKVGD